jgi:purine-binding chemotaxis protein CheW
MEQSRSNPALLVSILRARCAFPLEEVIEIMRPLPVEPLANAPDWIQGVARIRGAAVPVVRLAALFQADSNDILPTRFVTLRLGQRCIALGVQSVIGVIDLSDCGLESLPPLLKSAQTDVIRTLGTLDADFLVMLNTARLVPDSVWQAMAQAKAAQ